MGDSTYPGGLAESSPPASKSGQATRQSTSPGYAGEALAAELLRELFRRMPHGVAVRLWSGAALRVGTGAPCEPRFVLVFHKPEAVSTLVLGRDPLRLADAFFRGDIDIEGDFFAAMVLRDHLQALRLPLGERLRAAFLALKLRALNRDVRPAQVPADGPCDRAFSSPSSIRAHSRAANRGAIQFHYDVSNEFYQLWLDPAMVYSCAYFERADETLEEAQQAKLEHICRKLLLQRDERLLDIGCGWGALILYAAQHYGVRAHGITLSVKQLEAARARIAAAGLEGRVTVELRDYRDLEGECVYDKIASVGMFEHVGLNNLPLYFATVRRLLKPAGLFLNHGITHEQAGWNRNVSTDFINRYVFPDGQLDSVGNIQRRLEEARFEIADVEGLRQHYALTLRAWVGRLERRHARALDYVSEATYRVWRVYMAACALEFESGHLGIYQILAAKRPDAAGHSLKQVPLTRRHVYERRSEGAAFGA